MEHLRQHIPDTLGGLKVIAVEDYQSQERINKDDGTTESIALPKSNVIRLIFDEGFVALRPSGTEPKLKFYLSLNVDDLNKCRMISINIYLMIINKIEKSVRITPYIESLYSRYKVYFN